MDEDQGQGRTQQLSGDPEQDAAQLRTEIEETRAELGDTVEALAAKTDVKTRVQERADEIKRTASEKLSSARPGGEGSSGGAGSALERVRVTARQNPVPTAALGALAGGFLIGRLTGRERR